MPGTKERRRAHCLARKIIRFLRKDMQYRIVICPFDETFLKRQGYRPSVKLSGLCDYATETLYVNARTDVVATIVHEVLHVLYPPKGRKVTRQEERAVERMEALVMRHITRRQSEAILFWAVFRTRAAGREMKRR